MVEEDDYRKIQIMMLQLKYECKKRDKLTMVMGVL